MTDQRAAALEEQQRVRQERQRKVEEKRRHRQEAAQRAKVAEAKAKAALQKKRAEQTKELMKLAMADAEERDRTRPADSYCVFSCDPYERHGRLALANRLNQLMNKLPTVIMKFRKTNGSSGEYQGIKFYDLHFSAVIALPQGYAAPAKGMQKFLVGANASGKYMELRSQFSSFEEIDTSKGGETRHTKKKKSWSDPVAYKATGKVRFVKTEKGWQGNDGVVYSD